MHYNTFAQNVIEWARVRDIYEQSSEEFQISKAMEEVAEYLEATTHGDREDAIGDIAVCIVNAAYFAYGNGVLDFDPYDGQGPVTFGNVCLNIVDGYHHIAISMLQRYATDRGYDFGECLRVAWEGPNGDTGIKNRGGMMFNGKFVKEASMTEAQLKIYKKKMQYSVSNI